MSHHVPTSATLVVACTTLLATGFGSDVPAAFRDAAAPNALVGTWRLVEHWNRDSAGVLTHQFGPNPVGYFIHDGTGHFSVQIMRTPPIGALPETPDSAALRALRELVGGYFGGFGTFTVDTGRAESVYHVEGSTVPGNVGTDVRLLYRIARDSLFIGDGTTWRRVWMRVR